MIKQVIVSRNVPQVMQKIAAGKLAEAFGDLRHKYSNYDRVWVQARRDEFPKVADMLRKEVMSKYPELRQVAQSWKA